MKMKENNFNVLALKCCKSVGLLYSFDKNFPGVNYIKHYTPILYLKHNFFVLQTPNNDVPDTKILFF